MEGFEAKNLSALKALIDTEEGGLVFKLMLCSWALVTRYSYVLDSEEKSLMLNLQRAIRRALETGSLTTFKPSVLELIRRLASQDEAVTDFFVNLTSTIATLVFTGRG